MRLDAYMTSNGLATGRQKAKELIEAGAVTLNGIQVTKASAAVNEGDTVTVDDAQKPKFVGRGGLKLEAAFDSFNVDASGLTCVDIGASTGGFTDCLLGRGALKVYAVDCGSGQMAQKLRDDDRVVVIENFNAREMTAETTKGLCDLAVMDVSFISQTLIYPAIVKVLKPGGLLISLVKPQFEAGRENLSKNGIVKSDAVRQKTVDKVMKSAYNYGLICDNVIESPIKGGDGNTEYLAVFRYRGI
nr:TlyA family RNA methyltransferase [Clostridia bacterium]